MDLPAFSNEEELAFLMHVDLGLIKKFYKHSSKFYKRYNIEKSNNKVREIKQPCKDLKAVQAWILRNILDKLKPTLFATAYIKEKNILSNVGPHSNNRYFILLDLEDFFPSISSGRVYKIFSLIGYSINASYILSMLTTCDDSLPQGAVTSPSLSNLIAAKLDRRIAGYTSRRNIIYTRYSDDITLSSNNPIVLSQALKVIQEIIKTEHFEINMDKLRVLGPRRRCTITGLVKNNSDSKFGIGRKKKKKMRAIMHNYIFSLKKDDKYNSKESIVGWLNYLKNVDTESFNQMHKYWDQLIEKSKST